MWARGELNSHAKKAQPPQDCASAIPPLAQIKIQKSYIKYQNDTLRLGGQV